MTASYGENYKDDENISVREDKYGGNKFYTVADKTSGTNYSRSLLRESAPGKFCLVLSTPPVAQLTPRARDEFGVPRRFVATDQAPPRIAEHEWIYVFNWDKSRYDAKICKEISWINKTKKTTNISCSKLIKQ